MNIVSTFTILGDVVVRWSYLINNMLFLESGELQDCVECVTTGLTGMLNSFYHQPKICYNNNNNSHYFAILSQDTIPTYL